MAQDLLISSLIFAVLCPGVSPARRVDASVFRLGAREATGSFSYLEQMPCIWSYFRVSLELFGKSMECQRGGQWKYVSPHKRKFAIW